MANKIIPKKSTVAGKVPAAGDLDFGEIAVNLADGLIYAKDGSGTVISLGGGGSGLPSQSGNAGKFLTTSGTTASWATIDSTYITMQLGFTPVSESGSYSNPAWITALAGSKITGNISGNAANITGTYAGSISSSQVTTGLGFTPANSATVTGDWNVKTNGVLSLISGNTNSYNGTTALSGVYLPHGTGAYGTNVAGRLDNLYFRTEENGTWASWRKVLHEGNFSTWAVPWTGGTLTGGLTVQSGSSTGRNAFQSTNDASVYAQMEARASGETATLFGQTLANWTYLRAAGASLAGMMLGTAIAAPVIMGTNNVEAWRIHGSTQNVTIGTTTDSGYKLGVSGTLNASGAITQGGNQVLHAGNYTNYAVAYNAYSYALLARDDTLNADTSQFNKFWTTAISTATDRGTKPINYVTITNLGGTSSNGMQIASYYGTTDSFYVRRGSDNAASVNGANAWQPWRELIHTGNFNAQALSSAQVTTALGFTPYNATNPSGYITSAALSSYAPLASPTFTGTVTLPAGSIGPGLLGSTSASVTAAGTTQATATALISDINIITTSTAGTGLGVVMMGATSGKYAVIVNRSANAINLYPASGHSFDGLGVNVALSIPVNGFIEMYGSSSTQWHSTYQAVTQGAFVVGNIPGNAANITGTYAGTLTSSQVTTGLGFTPYNSTNPSGYITASGSITGSSGSVTGLTLTSSSNGINPDSATQNQIGYNVGVSLFGQTDGGLYSSAYSSSWIHQIYGDFRTGQIAIRGKNSGTWQAWRTVLDSSNYTSYSPSLTGSGASGTWGINISGNAATVSTVSATQVTNLYSPNGASVVAADSAMPAQGNSLVYTLGLGPSGNDGHILGMTWANTTSAYGAQIWLDTDPTNRMAIRSRSGTGVWNGWSEVLTALNYNSYAPTLTGTGASGTWSISVSGNSATTSQRTFSNVRTDGINRGSYGSISIAGKNTSYFGIDFTDDSMTWMGSLSSSVSFGAYKSNSTWAFYFDWNGVLQTGTVPWTSINSRPTALSSFTNDSGYITSSGNAATATTATNVSGGYAQGSYLGVQQTGGSGAGLSLYNGYTTGQPTYGIMFATTANFSTHGSVTADWATYFTMDSTANRGWVFRNTTSGNVASVNNSGTAVFNGNVTAYSDERLKTNWRDLPIDFVEQLALVKHGIYDRTDDALLPTQVGVSAQSLRRILPNAVDAGAGGILSVAYGNAAMVSAVKLAERVVEQDARIARLEALIEKLIEG